MQPIRTTSAKQIIEALDTERHKADLRTDGEMATEQRRYWTGQRDALDLARAIVRGMLPYCETDAIQLVMPSVGIIEAERLLDGMPVLEDDPSDPSLPFVRETVAA